MARTDSTANGGSGSGREHEGTRPKKKTRPPKKNKKRKSSQHHDFHQRRIDDDTQKMPYRSAAAASSSSDRGPSDAALALSATLKDLSSRKRLKDALSVYRDAANDSIRDGHHGSIMVDCCSRCGDVQEGERIVAEMEAANIHVSVQAKTALLKGYAHSGRLNKGAELYRVMCQSRNRRDHPNVRTLNTLLRGCLWNAATLHQSGQQVGDNGERTIAGGVVTSEEAWKLSRDMNMTFDSSSYEYSITLLCQALRCDEARQRLEEMKQSLLVGAMPSSDGSLLESIAASTLSLARAFALLNQKEIAMEYASMALSGIEDVMAAGSRLAIQSDVRSGTIGGKRSWKKSKEDEGNAGSSRSRRESSNTLFRSHRLSEMKTEAKQILGLCSKNSEADSVSLPHFLSSRLLYFSGGGTTDLSATKGKNVEESDSNVNDTKEQLLASLWLSFGLSAAVGRASSESAKLGQGAFMLEKKDHKALRAAEIDYSSKSVLSQNGSIDFCQVFGQGNANTSSTSGNACSKPINIELGAGSGDWVCLQASAKPSQHFVSVELRSDRVAQTFSKLLLSRAVNGSVMSNVCCVAGECGSFLHDRIENHSIDTIYVNHPEPPTQTYGSNSYDLTTLKSGSEPAHMLNSETIITAAKCLARNGRGKLVIVTDNKWYGLLICNTIEIVMQRESNLLTPVDLERKDGFYHVGGGAGGLARLFEGTPNEAIGHVPTSSDSGTSYFDRLWRTGAGTHAERSKRFAVVVRTYREGDEQRKKSAGFSKQQGKGQDQSSRKPRMHGDSPSGGKGKRKKPNKKKSAAKQQRRNERRLLAKELSGGGPAEQQLTNQK